MDLHYRSFVNIEDLQLGECTIHRASSPDGKRWWNLWFYVARDTDGQPEAFVVPVMPNGSYTESGPGGRSWGLARTGDSTWQVSPSINVLDDASARAVVAGLAPTGRSLWHQTPGIVDVPSTEAWVSGTP
jgi:hypothetical protein